MSILHNNTHRTVPVNPDGDRGEVAALVAGALTRSTPAKIWDNISVVQVKPGALVTPNGANGALCCAGYYDLCLNVTINGTSPTADIQVYVWSKAQTRYMLRKTVTVAADAGLDPIDVGVADYVFIGVANIANVTGLTVSGAMRG